MNRAQALDRLLYRERVKLFGQGEFQGWDVSVSRLFFVRALMARELGAICDRSFSESSIKVFQPTRPQQFYFNSFITTDLFIAGSPRWKVVDHYDTTLNWVDDSNASCFDFDQIAAQQGALKTHAAHRYGNAGTLGPAGGAGITGFVDPFHDCSAAHFAAHRDAAGFGQKTQGDARHKR